MILTIAPIKGGVEKSTLAINITGGCVSARWGSGLLTALNRIHHKRQYCQVQRQSGIACSHDPDGCALSTQAMEQKTHYDDVLIECGGRDSTAVRATLTLTDYLLLPVAPGSFEVWAM